MDDDNVIRLRKPDSRAATLGALAGDPERYPVLNEVRGMLDAAGEDIAAQMQAKEQAGDFTSVGSAALICDI